MSSARTIAVILTVCAAVVIVLFQNCSSSGGPDGGVPGLVEKIDEPPLPGSPANPNNPDSPTDPGSQDPLPELPPLPDPGSDPNPPAPTPTPTATPVPPATATPSPTPGHTPPGQDPLALSFVCFLDGHGGSAKIGFSQNILVDGGKKVQDVCMSENACLNIASQVFAVKGAEMRGFCQSSDGKAIILTDEQVQGYVDQILSP